MTDAGRDAKLAFLSDPAGYPERPDAVEVRETNMSWVFLTDRHAYKMKKPVERPFLDFRDLAARRHFCAEEVRLNRRFAPSVYLGVVALTVSAAGRYALDGAGEFVEPLVKMRRLPAERTLEAQLREGCVERASLMRFARKMARFYRDAAPLHLDPEALAHHLHADIAENVSVLDDAGLAMPRDRLRRSVEAQWACLADAWPVMAARAAEGRFVEGHGDLRPEHVYLLADPCALDCLEFNLRFRVLDPADELSFLGLECAALGDETIAGDLLTVYRRETADRPPEALLRFYRVFRACVRAKLAAWHVAVPGERAPRPWLDKARSYLERVERELV